MDYARQIVLEDVKKPRDHSVDNLMDQSADSLRRKSIASSSNSSKFHYEYADNYD